MKNAPSPTHWLRWFDPRFRQPGTWGYILNRITAIGLTVYLVLHLGVLSTLARGSGAYDTFIAIVKSPGFKFGELLVVAAGIIHGTNGIRIVLNSFGLAVRYQKAILYALMTVSAVGIAYFTYVMFVLD
jgi:succinate dehydrogenase / fumarate reductase, cytochrome b subunit